MSLAFRLAGAVDAALKGRMLSALLGTPLTVPERHPAWDEPRQMAFKGFPDPSEPEAEPDEEPPADTMADMMELMKHFPSSIHWGPAPSDAMGVTLNFRDAEGNPYQMHYKSPVKAGKPATYGGVRITPKWAWSPWYASHVRSWMSYAHGSPQSRDKDRAYAYLAWAQKQKHFSEEKLDKLTAHVIRACGHNGRRY